MALIVSGFVTKQMIPITELGDREVEYSDLYLELNPDYLEAYDLGDGDKLVGKVEEIGEDRHETVEDLEATEVSFVLAGGYTNRIFAEKGSFDEFREWGFISEGFWLSVRFEKAVRDGEEIEIYTKRDIEA
jgi:hypothetical protein